MPDACLSSVEKEEGERKTRRLHQRERERDQDRVGRMVPKRDRGKWRFPPISQRKKIPLERPVEFSDGHNWRVSERGQNSVKEIN